MEVARSAPSPQPPAPTPRLRDWLPTLELALATAAAALWYLQGGWVWYAGTWPGPWPLLLLGLMVALTVSREGLRAFRTTPFTVPLLAFLATAGVALWAAYDPEIALAKAWLIVGALGLYWALAHQPDPARLTSALGVWALFCIALPAYFFVTTDWASAPVKIPVLTEVGAAISARLPSLMARRLNHNVTGGLLAVALPFTIPLLALPRRIPGLGRAARALLFGAGLGGLAAGMLGLLLTVSRGAWMGVAGAGGLWLTWRLLGRLGRRGRLLAMAALLLIGAGLMAAGARALIAGSAMPGVPAALITSLRAGLLNRLRLLTLGALLARDTLFTGIGLGMFEMHLSIYTLLIHVGYIEHSHNLFLDLAIEQGIPGLVAFVVLAATAYAWAIRSLKVQGAAQDPAASDPGLRTFDFGLITESALASLTALLIHGMADDALYGSRGLLLLFVPLGVLAASDRIQRRASRVLVKRRSSRGSSRQTGSTRRPGGPRVRPWMRTVFCTQLVFLPVLTVIGIGCILGVRGESGNTSRIANRWRSAWHANLGVLAQARTELTLYDQHHFNDPTMDEVRRREDLPLALARFERAVALDPANPAARQRLAAIALARGQYDEALHAMQVLWDAGDRDRVTRLLYGDALVAAGRADEAVPVVRGLEFAEARLLGQAWSRYHVGGDPVREGYARAAAAAVKD